MAELKQEEICEEVERLSKPASSEAEILNGEKGPEVKPEETDKKEVVEEKKEEKLPKLSAAEFRAYNSMAEHMEYFVRPQSFLRGVPWRRRTGTI